MFVLIVFLFGRAPAGRAIRSNSAAACCCLAGVAVSSSDQPRYAAKQGAFSGFITTTIPHAETI